MAHIYSGWLADMVGRDMPAETRATCDNCPMCAPTPHAELRFHPDVKCCSYWPALPNYLAGAILEDTSEDCQDGRDRLALLLERSWATPLAVLPSPAFRILYSQAKNQEFGTALLLKCPYLIDGGGCSIWRFRNAVCLTWFCKFQRGRASRDFWEAVRRLLSGMESQLGVWACLELGLSGGAVRRAAELLRAENLKLQSLDGYPKNQSDRQMWEKWNNTRAEFYQKTARLVSALSWSDALAVSGPECAALARELHDVAAELFNPPEYRNLKTMPLRVLQDDGVSVTVSGHSETDGYVMDRRLLGALHNFNTLDVAAALEAVKASTGLEITDHQLDELVQWGCLAPVASSQPLPPTSNGN